jgi:hypothetical protein
MSTRLATVGGKPVLIDENGRVVKAETPIPITAGELATILAGHMSAATTAERKAADARLQQAVQATTNAVAEAYAKAGVKAGMQAGVKASADYVTKLAANMQAETVVRHRVERDAKGQIIATYEERVPRSALPEERKAIGFGRPDDRRNNP